MDTSSIKQFVRVMTAKMLEAGELAIEFQGKVANLGKEVAINPDDSERVIARGQAKTEIDEKVQEMLLASVKETLGTTGIKIDAEENTPSKKLFTDTKTSLTVVIDPIDGTLEYLNGSDEYSINVGLIEDGKVLTALIYFPKWKKLYFLDENKKTYVVQFDQKLVAVNKKEIQQPIIVQPNVLYTNNRVSEKLIANLEMQGFIVFKDDGGVSWPKALLNCISGKFTASIFHSPQIRDVLLGAFIENFSDGYMVNWEDKIIHWPSGGRIPSVIFGVGRLSQKIPRSLT